MAQESCNLDKEEAEILKPPSSPSLPPSSLPPIFINHPKSTTIKKLEPLTLNHVDKSQPSIRFINRCSCCCKRVGLAGFRCRCGELFCALHRHSEAHDCSFDYKAVGREEISKANPVVRASKIIKI